MTEIVWRKDQQQTSWIPVRAMEQISDYNGVFRKDQQQTSCFTRTAIEQTGDRSGAERSSNRQHDFQ